MSGQGSSSSRKPSARSVKSPPQPSSSALATPKGSGTGRLSSRTAQGSKPATTPSGRTSPVGRSSGAGAGAGAGVGGSSKPSSAMASPAGTARSRQSPVGTARASQTTGRSSIASPVGTSRSGYVASPVSTSRSRQSPENTARSGKDSAREVANRAIRPGARAGHASPSVTPRSARGVVAGQAQQQQQQQQQKQQGEPLLPPAAQRRGSTLASARKPPPGGPQKMKRSSIVGDVVAPPVRQPVPKPQVPKIVLSMHGNASCAERRISRALILIEEMDPYQKCTGALEIQECLPQWRGRYSECVNGLVRLVSDRDRKVREAAAGALVSTCDRGDPTVVSAMHEHLQAKLEAPTLACPPPPKDEVGIDSKQTSELSTAVKSSGGSKTLGAGSGRVGAGGKVDEAKEGRVRDRGKRDSTSPTSRRDTSSSVRGNASNTARSNASNTARSNASNTARSSASNTARSNASNTARSNASNTASNTGRSGASSGRSGVDEASHHRTQGGGRNAPTPTPREGARQRGVGAHSQMGGAGGRASTPTSQNNSASPGRSPQSTSRSPSQTSAHSPDSKEGTPRSQDGTPRSRASGGSIAGSKQSSPISSPGRSTGNDSYRSSGRGTSRLGGGGGGTGRSAASASSADVGGVGNSKREARSTPVGSPRAAGRTPRVGDKGSVGGGSSSPSGSVKKAGNGAGLNSSIESPKSQELIKTHIAAESKAGGVAGVDVVAVDDGTGVGGGIEEGLQLEAISVIEKVAQVGDEESLNILGSMVLSRSLAVRNRAVQAIRELLPRDNDEMLERVAQRVAVHFNNVRPEVRSSSLRAVGIIGKRGHQVILQLVMRLLIDSERHVREEAMRACLLLCDESQKGAAVAAIAETMVDSVGGGSVRMRRRALHALGQLSGADNEGEDGAGVMKEFQHSTAGNSNFEVHVPLEGDSVEEGALERIGVPPEKSAYVWDGLGRVPYSISGCFGPIGGVVYIRCNSRVWTYDMKSMRVGHVQHEAYWDVWGGTVEHGNVRFSHLVPDMVNPAYSCSIGPVFRDGAWKVLFLYADSGLCLCVPIMVDKALSGGCPFHSETAEVIPLSSVFPSMSNAGVGQQSRQSQRGNTSPISLLADDRYARFITPDCASGEWMHEGVPVFMSFAEGQVCYFTPDPSFPGGYMPLKGPFVVRNHFEGVSRNHIEAVWGPVEVMEHVEGGRWRSRMVVMLVSSKSVFEVDILTRKCHKKERSHLEVDPFDIASDGGEWTRAQDGLAYTLPETPRIRRSTSNAPSRAASSEAISREPSVASFGSRPASRASVSNEPSGESSLEEGDVEGLDPCSDDGASSTGPRARRPWNLVTVNKPPPKIKLGGYLPHCGEVCGEYAIVEEVWGRTDRPLYVQVTSDKEASHKSMQAAKGLTSGAGLNSTLLMSMTSGRTSSMNRTISSSSTASIAAGIEGGGTWADRDITSPLPAGSPRMGPALHMRPGHEASGIVHAATPSLGSQSQEFASGASPHVGVHRQLGSRLASPESVSSGTGPLQSMSQPRFLGSRPGSQESIQSVGAFDSNTGDYEWSPMFLYWVWQGEGLVDEDASGYWVVGDQPGETDGGMMCESDAGNPIECLSPWQFWDGKKWTVAPESFKLSVPNLNKQNLASDADQARQIALASMAPNLRSTIATLSSQATVGTGGIEAKRAGAAGHNEKYDHYVLQELSEEFGRLASSGSESGLPEGGSRRGSFKLSPRSMARRYSQIKKKRGQELSDRRSKAESALLDLYKDSQDVKYGWIWKLNSAAEGHDIKDWRERLVILDNAVMSYISEKQEGQLVKICDIRNVKKISEANFSVPGCSAALELTFLDESSITFGMKTGKERIEWNKAMRLQMSADIDKDKLAEEAEYR